MFEAATNLCLECMNRYNRRRRERPRVVESDSARSNRLKLLLKVQTLSAYSTSGSPACRCCQDNILEFMDLDHTLNNGRRDPIVKRGARSKWYRRLRTLGFPQNLGLQTSCSNCNSARAIFGVCPHKEGCPDFLKSEIKISNSAKYRRRQKLRVLSHYGVDGVPKCHCCGLDDPRFLCLDHINGGGTKHRKQEGHLKLERWLRQNGLPPGYRTLCYNCNASLGRFGYCPHQSPELRKPIM